MMGSLSGGSRSCVVVKSGSRGIPRIPWNSCALPLNQLQERQSEREQVSSLAQPSVALWARSSVGRSAWCSARQ